MFKKIKSGFTLAETLITLLILGIILVFILPSLISTKPSESKLLYKKTFFTISEAMMAVVNNSDYYDITQDEVLKHPEEYDSNEENFCQYLTSYLNTVGTINCNDSNGNFRLANGVVISHVPKKATKRTNPDTSLDEDANDDDLYFLVGTDGTIGTESDLTVECTKRKVFKIRYTSNGKIYTRESDACENSILESGTRIQKDRE